jgi:hypothetical protein
MTMGKGNPAAVPVLRGPSGALLADLTRRVAAGRVTAGTHRREL